MLKEFRRGVCGKQTEEVYSAFFDLYYQKMRKFILDPKFKIFSTLLSRSIQVLQQCYRIAITDLTGAWISGQ